MSCNSTEFVRGLLHNSAMVKSKNKKAKNITPTTSPTVLASSSVQKTLTTYLTPFQCTPSHAVHLHLKCEELYPHMHKVDQVEMFIFLMTLN